MHVPLTFWRGCGLSDRAIQYLTLSDKGPNEYFSCFISYSSKDFEFASRLHSDLQENGVRCWFAPHDLPIGAKVLDGIDEAIRANDKVLLILSHNAISSSWVEDEVITAFAQERQRNEPVLFPVRIDNAIMEADKPWASMLRNNRNIGNFTDWKQRSTYQPVFERLLRDLMIKT